MASSLLLLLDDIAAIMDDVAVLTKVAAKKTAGVLGDDLALNAEQVSGVRAERELPVVYAVFKGSIINKLILVPLAVALSMLMPQAIKPLLFCGGLYLCFEGVEKLAHSADHDAEARDEVDEATKIKGAIRTDFILSAEIIVITLGTLKDQSMLNTFTVLGLISLVMTLGVYGLVALIVRLDDIGLYLLPKGGFQGWLGQRILNFAPRLMKTLSVVGTIAMFLVGGGIIAEAIPSIHHGIEAIAHHMPPIIAALTPMVCGGLVGLIAGALAYGVYVLFARLFGAKHA